MILYFVEWLLVDSCPEKQCLWKYFLICFPTVSFNERKALNVSFKQNKSKDVRTGIKRTNIKADI